MSKKAFLPAMLAAISWLTVSGLNGATPDAAPNITYTASGTFSAPQVSGTDTLKLSGEPFIISIVASAGSAPIQHGSNWGIFSPFKMTGQVHSALVGTTPVNIASTAASILQGIGPTFDNFEAAFPVRVVGISLTIQAKIVMPAGTIAKPYLHPFSAVPLSPSNGVVTYSDGTNSTVLTINNGTLTATIPAGQDTHPVQIQIQ